MARKRPDEAGVVSQVKNPELVHTRRRQIVDASVHLFIEKGFHKTPTRRIAEAVGFSIGSLYEYVSSKDDVLYLVCDAIHDEIETGIHRDIAREKRGIDGLEAAIGVYIRVCDTMADHLQLIYQETASLSKKWRRRVLESEVRITNIFVERIEQAVDEGTLAPMEPSSVELLAHTIMVIGHMWAFRRWFLKGRYTLEGYIAFQTRFILAAAREGGAPSAGSGTGPDQYAGNPPSMHWRQP